MQLFLFLHVFESSIAFDSNYDYQHKTVTNKVLSLRVSDKCSNNNKSVTTITTTTMTTY